jgi:ParB family protein of integrating conjugative element (PFGI_1 class)
MSQFQRVATPPGSENLGRIFTLDELCLNPDNPRKSRNPLFEDLKASIRARGLNSVPFVTRDPRIPEGKWTFSDGGNTRYTIMRELWDETRDQRFFKMTCIEKPWPGRFQCIAGHLAENETHGQLTFIDKALSVSEARLLLEEERGKKISLRALAAELTNNGLPVHFSSVSRMEDVVTNIYPWMPVLLGSGFGGRELRKLLKLRHGAETIWDKYHLNKDTCSDSNFTSVFGQCCQKFDDPELWSLEMFTDELIGDLTEAFPCDDLDYDGWLLELRGIDKVKAEPAEDITIAVSPALPATLSSVANDPGEHSDTSDEQTSDDMPLMKSKPRDTVTEAEIPAEISDSEGSSFLVNDEDYVDETHATECPDDSHQPVAQSENHSLWHLSALQDDIEHLQSNAWRLCWDIASAHDCGDALEPASENASQPGYRLSVPVDNAHVVPLFLASLNDDTVSQDSANLTFTLLIGSSESATPVFDDEQTLMVFRLIRILRRLRELQRKSAASTVPVNEG